MLAAAMAAAVGALSADETPEQQASFLGYQAPVPANWQSEPPSSSMRLAQYRIPAVAPGEPAELIIYYFGQGQGGTLDANIGRWQGQFSTADGGTVSPKIERFEAAGLPITTVEFQGSYARGIGMGPAGVPKPDQILIAAIVETPQGNITIQLHGSSATVNGARDGLDRLLRGIRPQG